MEWVKTNLPWAVPMLPWLVPMAIGLVTMFRARLSTFFGLVFRWVLSRNRFILTVEEDSYFFRWLTRESIDMEREFIRASNDLLVKTWYNTIISTGMPIRIRLRDIPMFMTYRAPKGKTQGEAEIPGAVVLTMAKKYKDTMHELIRQSSTDRDSPTDTGKLEIKICDKGTSVRSVSLFRKGMNTIVDDAEGTFASILDDVRTFITNKDKYLRRGLDWKRGAILYGPAGNGKTTLAKVIASELKIPLLVPGADLMSLASQLSALEAYVSHGQPALILLDEADKILTASRRADSEVDDEDTPTVNNVGALWTNSALVELLRRFDGLASSEGIYLLLTANYPEMIVPQLLRPGRIDRYFTIKNCDARQARGLADMLCPDWSAEQTDTFVKMYGDGSFCTSEVRELLIAHELDPTPVLATKLDPWMIRAGLTNKPSALSKPVVEDPAAAPVPADPAPISTLTHVPPQPHMWGHPVPEIKNQ